MECGLLAAAWVAFSGGVELDCDCRLFACIEHVCIEQLEPLNSLGYLLALSMYASGGSFVDIARMRRLVKEREGLGANGRTVKELKKLLPYLRSRLGTHYNDGTSRDEEDNSINNTREVENSLEDNSEED
nr:hypothetical protein CFP56_71290 [Quercus suber]